MSAEVSIRLERLVLHDVDAPQHGAVIDALRTELERLLAADPPTSGSARGEIEVQVDTSGDDPRTLGAMAAAAVHRELTR